MAELPKAAQRIQGVAEALGLRIEVVEMPQSTRTADEAAAACGCAVGQIVKSLVFVGRRTATPYLLLVSGSNRVDEKAVAADLGEKLKRPDADYVRQLSGFSIGGIPPFGHDSPIATYMDQDLLAFDRVWAAAGTPKAVFASEPEALKAAAGAKVIQVTGPA